MNVERVAVERAALKCLGYDANSSPYPAEVSSISWANPVQSSFSLLCGFRNHSSPRGRQIASQTELGNLGGHGWYSPLPQSTICPD